MEGSEESAPAPAPQAESGAALTAEEQAALDAQLFEAVENDDAAAVVQLAGEGASADAKDGDGDPAVVQAAWNSTAEVVKALLRLGCDPNVPDESGYTALIYAAIQGEVEIGRGLLKRGAESTPVATGGRFEGKTALDIANEGNHREIVKLLEDHGDKGED